MNINKWRVVKHDFESRFIPFPWHVYPPGVPIATDQLVLNGQYRDILFKIYNGNQVISVHGTYAQAIARAQRDAHTTPTF